MNKPGNAIKNIINGTIIAGIIILLIGLYYWIIKAGIPYQDPTEELRIQYAINMGIGDELVKAGAVLLIIGIVGKIGMFVLGRRK